MEKEIIQELTDHIFENLVKIRRHLHQHPELSYQEVETGKFISKTLSEWGIPHKYGIADNGVVALIEGKNPGKKVIALRGDIDALPIEEANDVPYKSKNFGVMHACGHDVHTTSLLGAAYILYNTRDQWEGSVKCIFQPAEEKLPGGASIMIKQGVLKNPAPEAIFGQHVHPPLDAGKIGMKAGKYMASADEIYISVKGKGGHGALPHDCIDTVVMAANIIVALQQVVSRFANPTTPSVLTLGKINSIGGATNVIPNEVKIEGTFRTMDEKWRFEAHDRMKAIAESIAKGMGGTVDFDLVVGYPYLVNHEELTRKAWDYAVEYLGKENVVELPIRMTAEDFAYYSQEMPACFYRLGTGNPAKGITSPIHTNTFDIDESALKVGAGLMAWMALQELNA
ncbi:MAG: M20 family metallopeptidase [Saprospiraceae bacterium]